MDNEIESSAPPVPDFGALVEQHYRRLYQFAYNLTHDEAEASDLTQQTYLKWANKGHQLRDPSKAKTWLFTTLHREFLQARRRSAHFPHHDLDAVASELPTVASVTIERLDAATVVESLAQINEAYRAPLTLFYLEDYSYKEIAEILNIPVGTVQSRIARGKCQLYKILTETSSSPIDKSRESHE
jgi:RNA polymerase sigma-70 factor (ECF subfamily)